MAKGAQLKVTNLTENFTFEHFRKRYGETALPLVYLTKEGKVVIVSGNDTQFPNGIELISLLPVEALEEAKIQQAIAEQEAIAAQAKAAEDAALAKAKAEEEAERQRLEQQVKTKDEEPSQPEVEAQDNINTSDETLTKG